MLIIYAILFELAGGYINKTIDKIIPAAAAVAAILSICVISNPCMYISSSSASRFCFSNKATSSYLSEVDQAYYYILYNRIYHYRLKSRIDCIFLLY